MACKTPSLKRAESVGLPNTIQLEILHYNPKNQALCLKALPSKGTMAHLIKFDFAYYT